MVYYNMTNLTSNASPVGMFQGVNTLSGSILGVFILVAAIVIMFVAFKNFPVRTTIPIISFISTLFGIFLAVMNLIPDFIMYILIIGTAGAVLSSIFINPEG